MRNFTEYLFFPKIRYLAHFILLLVSGVSLVFALAPYRLYWLAPFSLGVPIFLVQRYPQFSFRYGYLWALSAYGACFFWIYYSLFVIAGFAGWITFFLVAGFILYLAIYPALAFLGIFWITKHLYVRWLMVFPALWTLTEYLRGKLLTGFSWGEVGLTQIAESPLSSLAPIFGIHGVTLVLMIISGATGLFLVKPTLKKSLLLAIAIFSIGFATHQMKTFQWTKPLGKPIRVALAQGNIPQSLKWDPDIFRYTLDLYYQQAQNTNADLLIFPESAMPALDIALPLGYLDGLGKIARSSKMSLALGILRKVKARSLNTVLSLDTQQYYVKQHLVPFGEYIPFGLSGLLPKQLTVIAAQSSVRDAKQLPLRLASQRIAFNICFEDSFGDELTAQASDSTMLANVSNLAWFGPYRSPLDQHLQLSQARALENGRFMLRATNTGRTAIIAPNGEVRAMAPTHLSYVLVGMAQGYEGLTPYMRYGDSLILGLCLAMIIGAIYGTKFFDRKLE